MGLFGSSENKPSYRKLKEEGCLITLSVEIPHEEVEAETQNQLLRIQSRARIPGFRPGKAPLEMVKRTYLGAAREETTEELLRRHVPQALRDLGLSPVAPPRVTGLDHDARKPLRVQVEVEVPPRVSAKDYAKIPVVRKAAKVTDQDLAGRIEDLRESHARLVASQAQEVGPGHYVIIDYEAFRDGKPLPGAKGESELVDMTSDQTIEGLVDGLKGQARDQTRSFPVKLAGRPAELKATVREIKEKRLPELDAEFAKDLGFPDVAELKSKLREVMEKEGRVRSEREVNRQLEEALLASNRLPVPPSLVEAELERLLERVGRELTGGRGRLSDKQAGELRPRLKSQAENEIRMSYILASIAEKEKLQAAPEEFDAELARHLADATTPDEREAVQRRFSDNRDQVMALLRDRKAFSFVKERAAIREEA